MLFVDLAGRGTPREILLKDRYRGFWIFDKDLKLLWEGLGQTGHYPYPADINADRQPGVPDRLFALGRRRHAALEPRRRAQGSRRRLSIGNFTGRPGAACAPTWTGRTKGSSSSTMDGTLVKHVRLGHAQTQSVGKFRPDLPGLQILIATFWRNPGIVTLLDADANILAQEEMIPGSSHLEPVNWRGDGQEFGLLSGNVREGGMIDGQLRRVVMFPDDGHPDLAAAVRDLTGDRAGRDRAVGSDARVDLHAGPAVRRLAHLRADAQSGLQRLELSSDRVAARLGRAAVIVSRPLLVASAFRRKLIARYILPPEGGSHESCLDV